MIPVYFFALFFLSIYSYSQIDLNLTLLQTPWFLNFKDTMVSLGYFNRQLSTLIFTLLLILLFAGYWKLKDSFPPKGKNWKLMIGGLVVLSLISYPFLSHDFFNYMFDARIVTSYHLNPYFFKALDFPSDTWIRFMQWTHRTYPYGPVWLAITVVPSALGFGKFILTMLNLKLLFIGAYPLSCYVIYKLKPNNVALFALNPLVIIESLYSPHLDLVMLALALLALLKFKWLNIFLSVGTKFSTLTLLPVLFFQKKKWFIDGLITASYVGVLIQILNRELLPHYFLVPFGFTALSDKKGWIYLMVVLSVLLLLVRYLPFLYTGQWFSQ